MTQIIPIVDNNPLKRKTFKSEDEILSLEGHIDEQDGEHEAEPTKRMRYSLTATSPANDTTPTVNMEQENFIFENDTVKRFRNQFISNKKRARKGQTSPNSSSPSFQSTSPNVFSYSPASPCASDSDSDNGPSDTLFEEFVIPSTITTQDQMIVDTSHDWEFLPSHLLCLIFSFMSQPHIITSIFGVCTHWYDVAKNSKLLWRKIDFSGLRIKNTDDALDFLNHLTTGIKSQKQVPSRSCMNTSYDDSSDDDDMDDFPHVRAGILSKPQFQQLSGIRLQQILFDGDITFPKSCSRMTHDTFKQLRQIYPRLTGLYLPPVDQISTSSNSQMTTTTPTGVKSISDSSLQQISLFPNIQQLCLNTHNRITDTGIDELTKRVHTLISIQLDNCNKLTLQSFKNIIERSPQIKSISLLNNTCQLDDQAISMLAKHGRFLQELRIDINVSMITMASLQQFVQQCKKLKSLYIRVHDQTNSGNGVSDMMGAVVSLLCSSLQSLEKFTLMCASDGICIRFPKIVNQRLTSIHISKCELFMRPEINCPNLQNIFFDHCRSIHEWEFQDRSMTNIREMRIRSSALTGITLTDFFNKTVNLRDLEIFDCKLSESLLRIAGLPHLEKTIIFMCNDLRELYVRDCIKLHTLSIDVCMELLKIHLDCPNLATAQFFVLPQIQYPKLAEFEIRSDKLETLNLQRAVMLQRAAVNCVNLDSLNMAGCRDLQRISPLICPKLDKFAVGSHQLDFANDQQISKNLIQNCPRISMLSISNSPLLDDSTIHYMCANLSQLQALVISNCTMLRKPHIEGSSIKGIQMTDCPAMSKLCVSAPNLAKLFLRNCSSISDDTLEDLSRECPHVKYLEICNCANIRQPRIQFEELSDLHFNKCKNLVTPILNCPKLKKLLFFSCEKFNQVDFVKPSNQCAEVLFSDCNAVSDALITSLHRSARNIQAIVFQKCDSICRPSFAFSNLKVLRFADCGHLVMPHISAQKLSIASFQDCKSLKFDEERIGTAIGSRTEVIEFVNCENLHRLRIDCEIVRVSIQTCDHLQELIVNSGQKLQVLHCESLVNLSANVEEMTVRQCNELKNIQASSSLRSIELTSCMRVSDICVTALLNRCPDLVKMFITSCNVASPVIKHAKLASLVIRSCAHLERLKLEGTNLHEFLVHECPRLSESNIHYATAAAARININLNDVRVTGL